MQPIPVSHFIKQSYFELHPQFSYSMIPNISEMEPTEPTANNDVTPNDSKPPVNLKRYLGNSDNYRSYLTKLTDPNAVFEVPVEGENTMRIMNAEEFEEQLQYEIRIGSEADAGNATNHFESIQKAIENAYGIQCGKNRGLEVEMEYKRQTDMNNIKSITGSYRSQRSTGAVNGVQFISSMEKAGNNLSDAKDSNEMVKRALNHLFPKSTDDDKPGKKDSCNGQKIFKPFLDYGKMRSANRARQPINFQNEYALIEDVNRCAKKGVTDVARPSHMVRHEEPKRSGEFKKFGN